MLATVIADGALRIEERPTPQPTGTAVLVAVHGAGLNGADLLQRRGLYPAPPGVPADIPGLELAGVVAAIGPEVRGLAEGDRVMAVVAGGAQASHCLVEASHLLAVPEGLDLVVAGGFPEAFSTAHDALVSQAGLRPGDRLLVTGAAGGVGTAAVQLGRLLGASTVASVRNPDHHGAVASLGADVVVLPEEVGDAGPYDVVLELVGAPSLATALPHLAPRARVVVIGVGGGAKLELNLLAVMAARAQLSGSTLRARDLVDKAVVARLVGHELLGHLASGRLSVPVAARYRLDDVEQAYRHFEAGGKLGKVLLELPLS